MSDSLTTLTTKLQALLLDPLVTSYADAEKMLDELLNAHKDYLPAFKK